VRGSSSVMMTRQPLLVFRPPSVAREGERESERACSAAETSHCLFALLKPKNV
jgi:hypothetical protein